MFPVMCVLQSVHSEGVSMRSPPMMPLVSHRSHGTLPSPQTFSNLFTWRLHPQPHGDPLGLSPGHVHSIPFSVDMFKLVHYVA